jgi:ribosome-associated protein
MNVKIIETELEFTYARSSGPGGQNVNKVNSKVVLHWDVQHSKGLPFLVKVRFFEKWKNKISAEGSLVLTSEKYRDQVSNRQDVIGKLFAMIDAVSMPPKVRKKTKPTKSSVEKRLHAKKEKTTRKNDRKRVSLE